MSRLTAISTFSKQVATFYEKKGFISSASQAKSPLSPQFGFESVPVSTAVNRSVSVTNNEKNTRIGILKTRHPQALRRESEIDRESLKLNEPESYGTGTGTGNVFDTIDDNTIPGIKISQANIPNAVTEGDSEVKEIMSDDIDTNVTDLRSDLRRYVYWISIQCSIITTFEFLSIYLKSSSMLLSPSF